MAAAPIRSRESIARPEVHGVAVITGASIGLGRELARELATRGWQLVVDARRSGLLDTALAELSETVPAAAVVGLAGDVTDVAHRAELVAAAAELGPVSVVVNNASTLGASPLPPLAEASADVVRRTFETNVVAPLALTRELLPHLSPGAAVVDISSDAAVEAYPGWGVYGASKAALDHAGRVLAVEHPEIRVLSVDPGDMRTEMHQAAFPGEDISDRPLPHEAARRIVDLIESEAPSGRYIASDVPNTTGKPADRDGAGSVVMGVVLDRPHRMIPTPRVRFALDPALSATEPPEARGTRRDQVRLMVSPGDADPIHSRFDHLPRFLDPGDLLVVNTSATIPAAIDGALPDGSPVTVHFSTELPAGLWLVEVRRPTSTATEPLTLDRPTTITLTSGATVSLATRYVDSARLWVASVDVEEPLIEHLSRHGRAIRYGYVGRDWPIENYRSVFSRHPGSAEMPSASRPFTNTVVTDLVAGGVVFAPLILHTGVSSAELGEPPYPERYLVDRSTADLVNAARRSANRVVAVGTTVVRALATVTDDRGVVHPGAGWTDRFVTPDDPPDAVDGLLTGWHEPEATHLLMLEAVAGHAIVERAYRAAVTERYLWHEFGDVHLLFRESRGRR